MSESVDYLFEDPLPVPCAEEWLARIREIRVAPEDPDFVLPWNEG